MTGSTCSDYNEYYVKKNQNPKTSIVSTHRKKKVPFRMAVIIWNSCTTAVLNTAHGNRRNPTRRFSKATEENGIEKDNIIDNLKKYKKVKKNIETKKYNRHETNIVTTKCSGLPSCTQTELLPQAVSMSLLTNSTK